jgi:hypothetical protein
MRERVTDSFVRLLCCKWGVAPAAREMLQGLCEASTATRHVTETQGEEHVARNHNNDQRITFRDDRIGITPATTSPSQDPEQDPSWSWGMHLAGYVTPDTIQLVAKAPRHAGGARSCQTLHVCSAEQGPRTDSPARDRSSQSVSKSDRDGELFKPACRHLRAVARELVH